MKNSAGLSHKIKKIQVEQIEISLIKVYELHT